jgi:hypothetical protein
MRRHAMAIGCTLLMSRSLAFADPIAVTSGSMTIAGVGGNQQISLAGDGLSLTATGYENFVGLAACNPCIVGINSITVNAAILSFLPTASPATVRGTSYPAVFVQGTMGFTGPTVSAAAALGGTLTEPFSMSARLRGFANDSFSGSPLFDELFTGHGTATGHFEITSGPGAILVTSRDAVYRFDAGPAPAPTPEPASLLLIATSAAAIAVRRPWRRRLLDGLIRRR